MRVLVLWANSSNPNIGVRTLAEGTRALAERAWPGCDVRFHGTGGPGTGGNDGPMPLTIPRSILKEAVLGRKGLKPWLRGFDLIIDTRAGDSFTDIYTLKTLVRMSAAPLYAMRLGVPVVMGPQTIGPFSKRRSQIIASRTLRGSSLVLTRDEGSIDTVRDLARREPVLTTDVAFALPRPARSEVHDVLLNVSGLLWEPNPHIDHQAYRRSVREIVEGLLSRGRTITLFDHVLGTGNLDNDSYASAALNEELPEPLEIVRPESVTEVRATTASARLVIGARMHASLNALSVGTPCIPMAYSRKFAPLFDPLGWRRTVDLRTADNHARAVLEHVDADLEADVRNVLDTAEAAVEDAVQALRRIA